MCLCTSSDARSGHLSLFYSVCVCVRHRTQDQVICHCSTPYVSVYVIGRKIRSSVIVLLRMCLCTSSDARSGHLSCSTPYVSVYVIGRKIRSSVIVLLRMCLCTSSDARSGHLSLFYSVCVCVRHRTQDQVICHCSTPYVSVYVIGRKIRSSVMFYSVCVCVRHRTQDQVICHVLLRMCLCSSSDARSGHLSCSTPYVSVYVIGRKIRSSVMFYSVCVCVRHRTQDQVICHVLLRMCLCTSSDARSGHLSCSTPYVSVYVIGRKIRSSVMFYSVCVRVRHRTQDQVICHVLLRMCLCTSSDARSGHLSCSTPYVSVYVIGCKIRSSVMFYSECVCVCHLMQDPQRRICYVGSSQKSTRSMG